MPKNITLAIPDELTVEMEKLKEVNWSAVAREAIESYIKRRTNPTLTPILERLATEREQIYQEGYNKATEFVNPLQYADMEEVFDIAHRSDTYLESLLTTSWNTNHPHIPLSIPKGKPFAYYKGFQRAVIDIRDALEK